MKPLWLALLLAMPMLRPAAAAVDTSYPLTLTRGSRLVVDAAVNGHAVRALLDSAAEATLLDWHYAEALQLTEGVAATGRGSGAASFEAKLVGGVTLEAFGLTLRDQTVAVTDLGDVGKRLLGGSLDAILGREIFDAARLRIDIDRQRITVVDRRSTPRGVRLKLIGEHEVETVPVTVEGGQPVRATFDLGNGAEVLLSQSYARQRGLLSDGREVRTEQGGGLGGTVARQIIVLHELELAGKRFSNVAAAIDPQPGASDVNVGISILRDFRITTDYAQHAVWLEPVR